MFGINKKLYYTLSILMIISCLVVLVFTLTNVIIEKELGYLSSLALFLLSISFFITPSSKKMKIVDSLMKEGREVFYKHLEEKEFKGFEVCLYEKNQKLYLDEKDGFCFENLSYEDSLYIFKKLVRDYVLVIYSVYENNKIDFKKATIENFDLKIVKENKDIKIIKIVEKYEILK